MQLTGYVRKDGSVGFRNKVLIVPLTGCLASLAWRIADEVPNSMPLIHGNGCDYQGADGDLMATMLEHLATHPNVGGVLFLTMGCAAMLQYRLPKLVKESGRLVAELNMHTVGGTTATIQKGIELALPIAEALAKEPRVDVPLSSLVIGTKCGASNAESFSHCHPVLGAALDKLVDLGATSVLSEDCELYFAAHLIAERAVNKDIADALIAMKENIKKSWKDRFNIEYDQYGVGEDGTYDAAIQRSLEHAAKAGSRPIQAFFDMSEKVKGPGLVILNAPNTDLQNMVSLASAGCNIIAFTTGRGSVVGSPAAVTVKMTATALTAQRMAENIDLDVSAYVDGTMSLDEAADKTVAHIIAAANGDLQKAEILRHGEIAFPLRNVTF